MVFNVIYRLIFIHVDEFMPNEKYGIFGRINDNFKLDYGRFSPF